MIKIQTDHAVVKTLLSLHHGTVCCTKFAFCSHKGTVE